MSNSALESKAKRYLQERGRAIVNLLGFGTDGYVWKTNRATAVKVFERQRQYHCERDSYRRLTEHSITQIDGFAIPKLVDYDDELLIVEMAIVSPPYIIDFG